MLFRSLEAVGGGKAKIKVDTTASKTVEKREEAKQLTIKLSSSETSGDGEGKADVGKIIARKNNQIQQCYEKALQNNPDEGGKVKVTFTVGQAGTVTDVSVAGASGGFADCIRNRFMQIRGFPQLANPQSFTQSYVFSKN